MNPLSWHPQDLAMLERFYSADQLWTWENIKDGNGAEGKVLDWLQKCPLPRRHPLVLPVRRKDDSTPSWLCVAFSEMQCEELREHLNAFVGTAGCDFEGLRSTLPVSDKIASIAREWAGGNRIFDFNSLAAVHQKGLRERLERMLGVWALRPMTDPESLRTTEAMLREFELSLVNGDEQSAISWWEEIRAGGRLNAENLLFLKMQIPAAFGRWNDIDLDPNMPLLASAHRPRRTTAILIEAIWYTSLEQKVRDGDFSGALAVMRERIQGPLRGLFRTPTGIFRPNLVLTFLIAAAADAPPRHLVIETLIARLPEGSPERDFAGKIMAAIAPTPIPIPIALVDVLEQAREARDRDDFLGAWLLLKSLGNSTARCRLLLECAAEHWEEDTASIIKEAMLALSDEERTSVLASKQRLQTWDKISVQAEKATPAPSDWETWLHEVEANPSWDKAVSSARDASALWPTEIYSSSPSKISNLAGLLTKGRDAKAAGVVRFSLPHIAGFFLANGPQNAFSVIYLDLLLSLALDQRFGGEDWGLAENLVFTIMETGPSRADYEHLLSSITTIWVERGDPRRLDWALDLLDIFTAAPAGDPSARDAFFDAVCQTFHQHARRVQACHFELFGLLCEDLQRRTDFDSLPTPLPTTGPEEASRPTLQERLRDKVVGIYTLTEAAGLRAKQMLQRLCKGIDVRISHDYVGSELLRVIARESDYLIVVTRSAKHAATEFIKANRPPDKREVIYPTGKGSTSILTALRDAVET